MNQAAAETTDRRRRGRRWTWLLLGLLFLLPLAGLLLVVTVGALVVRSAVQAEVRVDEQVAALRARGEPVELSDFDPKKHGHDTSRGAKALIALQKIPKPSIEFDRVMRNDEEWPSPGSYRPLVEEVSIARPHLDALLEIVRGQEIYIPRDYGSTTPLFDGPKYDEHLVWASDLLQGQVVTSLGSGNQEEAVTALIDLFELARICEHEPYFGPKGRQAHLFQSAIDAIEYLLNHSALTYSQRDSIDLSLAQASNFRLTNAAQGERALVFSTLEGLKHRPAWEKLTGIDLDLFGSGKVDPVIKRAVLTPGHLAREQEFLLQITEGLDHAIDEPTGHTAIASCQEKLKVDYELNGRNHILVLALFPFYDGYHSTGLRTRQHINNARLALRIDAKFRETGWMPESLADVVSSDQVELLQGQRDELVFCPQEVAFQIHDMTDLAEEDTFMVIYATTDARTEPIITTLDHTLPHAPK